MHKPNWHCTVMDNAVNIEIDGITCITTQQKLADPDARLASYRLL